MHLISIDAVNIKIFFIFVCILIPIVLSYSICEESQVIKTTLAIYTDLAQCGKAITSSSYYNITWNNNIYMDINMCREIVNCCLALVASSW